MAKRILKIIVVDNDPIVRKIIARMLGQRGLFKVLATFGDGAEAAGYCSKESVDAVLMDIRMPKMDGFAAGVRIKEANQTTRVVLLSSYSKETLAKELEDSSADALLSKSAGIEEIEAALLDVPLQHIAPPTGTLTHREHQVIKLVCLGLTNQQIARRLGITEATVKTHVGSCMRKTLSESRTQLCAWAFNRL